MRKMHGGLLLPIVFLMMFLLLPRTLAQGSTILLSEILVNPDGADTGKEFIELVNTSTNVVDISGWDLDPGALPYFTFPAGTRMNPGATLVIHLRQDGQTTIQDIYTGSAFGSSDLVNTKGSAALFHGTAHTIDTLEDFIEYGDVGQTHEAYALQKGYWEQGSFLSSPIEGKSLIRICEQHNVSCMKEEISSPGSTLLSAQQETATSSGAIVPVATSTGTVLTLSVENTSTGATISPTGNTTGSGAVLSLVESLLPRNTPPIPIITLQGKGVTSGIAPFPLNLTGEQSTDDKGISNYLWDYGDGYTFQGKNPLEHVFEAPGMYDVRLTTIDTDGSTATTHLVITVTEKTTSIITAPNTSMNANTTNSVFSDSPCDGHSGFGVVFSELFPNPDGPDKGKEWIELKNTTQHTQCLSGLRLIEGISKIQSFTFPTMILGAGEYLIMSDSLTKISLSNKNGKIQLLDNNGVKLDQVEYHDAPSGKSWSLKGP